MVEQWIKKWRGIDRWPEADATVVSYDVLTEGRYREEPPTAKVTFFYRDATNSLQSGDFVVDSLTSLYNLQVNDTFQIRYSPGNPSKFYCSEAVTVFTEFRFVFRLCFAIIAVVVLAIILYRRN